MALATSDAVPFLKQIITLLLPTSNSGQRSAFTVLELLIAVSILMVLAGLIFIGVSNGFKAAGKAQDIALARDLTGGFSATAADGMVATFPATTGASMRLS